MRLRGLGVLLVGWDMRGGNAEAADDRTSDIVGAFGKENLSERSQGHRCFAAKLQSGECVRARV
jgi:hypothetical protein